MVDDAHKLYEGIKETEGNEHIDEYIHEKLELKPDDKGYNINLLSGRLDEIDACANHLKRIRRNYCTEVMKEWSQRLSENFPNCKKVEELGPANTVYTGIALPYKDIPEAIAIRIEITGKSLYYGLTYMPETKALRNELQDALSFVNDGNEFIKGSDWLYYKYVSFEDGYDKLKELIERMARLAKLAVASFEADLDVHVVDDVQSLPDRVVTERCHIKQHHIETADLCGLGDTYVFDRIVGVFAENAHVFLQLRYADGGVALHSGGRQNLDAT